MSEASACSPRRRVSSGASGGRPPSAAIAAPTRVDHPAVDRAVRVAQRLADADRVGEPLLLLVEPGVLVGVVELGGVDLGDLELEQRDLARLHPRVATQRVELRVDRRELVADRAVRRERRRGGRARERVEDPPLRGRREQRLVRVLRVEVEELHATRPRARSRSRSDRRRTRGSGPRAAPPG